MSDFKMQEGQLFVRVVPEDGKKPVVKASFMVGGVEYEGACWPAKSGKQGSYSGKVKVKQASKENAQVVERNDMDSEIPF